MNYASKFISNVIIAFFFLLHLSSVRAQPHFQKTFGGSTWEYGFSVRQTADGGYIIAGETNSFGAGSTDVYLVRTNSNGDTLWVKAYGGTGAEFGYEVQETNDGGFIITGRTTSFGAGAADVFLIKTNSIGDIVWSKTYGGVLDDFGYSVQQTTDNGYIVTGWTQNFGIGGTDLYLIKTDVNGDTLWTRTFRGTSGDYGRSVKQTNDGGYIVAGYTNSFGAGGNDIYLLKTDSNGDSLWTKAFGGTGADYAYSVVQTADLGYAVVGSTNSFGQANTNDNIYVVKTDALGSMVFSKVYGGGAGDGGNDYGYAITENSGGGLAITGSTDGFGGSFHVGCLLLTSSAGVMIGFPGSYGSSLAHDYLRSVEATSDGGYIMAGYTESFGAGGADIYIVKTDAAGENSNSCGSGALGMVEDPAATVESNTTTLAGSGATVANAPFITNGTATIGTKLPLGVLLTVTNISCFGETDGAVTATVAAGAGPFTYSWSVGLDTTETNDSLSAGTYGLTVIDNFGCNQTDSFTIVEPGLLEISFSIDTPANCNGDSNGVASALVSGGTGPFDYVWSTGANTFNSPDTFNTVSGLTLGTYYVTVTDDNGCIDIDTLSMGLGLSTGSMDAACLASNGKAWVIVSGGILPYTYQWDDPGTQTTDTAFSLAAGSYQVIVTDQNGCQDSVTVSVSNGQGPVITLDSIVNITCSGGSDGAVYVTVTTGCCAIPPFTYTWSNADTTEDIVNVTGGTYTFTAEDSIGCSTSETYTIVDPPQLVAAITDSVDISCNGANDGSITTAAIGGTAPYTYFWSPSGGSGTTASNLSANTYTVSILDANGCAAVSNGVTISAPAALVLTTDTASETCVGGDGKAWVIVSGGTGPFTYLWDLLAGSQTTDTAFNLTANTYNVTVTDGNGCSNTSSATIVQVGNPPIIAGSVIDVSCNGGNDGAVNISITGGTSAFTYNWSPGAQTTDTITGLSAGNNTLTVTDAVGCVATMMFTITEPALLSGSITTSTNLSCNGANDGTATFTATNGQTPYTYLWSGGGTTSSVSGLAPGSQSVTVTDACNDTVTDAVTITEPGSHSFTFSNVVNVSCNGLSDGTATVSATGGSSPYTYLWYTTPNQTSATATGLSQGTYIVDVLDACGNSVTDSVSISEATALSIIFNGFQNVTCQGFNDGDASVSVSGGTSPYTYLWSNTGTSTTITGLSGGLYTILVTDANGCTEMDSILLTEPTAIALSISNTMASCGIANGTATVAATGGSPISAPLYTYTWDTSPQQNDSAATGLPAGTYSVTVTDANGCTETISTTISQPPSPNPSLVASTTPSCPGDCDAEATVSSSGGIPPYTYFWLSPISISDSTATGLCAGAFELMVTGNDGCSAIDTITIQDPAPLVANMSGNNPSPGGCDGTATAAMTGGTPPYTYQWDDTNMQVVQTAIGLCSGEYSVVVTDSKGCMTTGEISLIETKEIFLPTAFSPNKNGINDRWYLRGDVEAMHLMVYNRWGEKVFETKDQAKGWDGTFRGKPLSSDTYSYYLKITEIGGAELIMEGNVLLIR